MERFFNTAGPQTPDSYTIDPLSRFDLEDILLMIRQQRYFVMHAPRQTGKTSCMLALRDYLNKKGDYIAVYANVEGGQALRNNAESVIKSTCDTLAEQFSGIVGNDVPLHLRDEARKTETGSMLTTYLRRLSMALPKPHRPNQTGFGHFWRSEPRLLLGREKRQDWQRSANRPRHRPRRPNGQPL